MPYPKGKVPYTGLDPNLFSAFHQELVAIKNDRHYTYTQRLKDSGYKDNDLKAKRTAINSKFNQKSLMSVTTLRALENLLSHDLFIALIKDVLTKERYKKSQYEDARYLFNCLKAVEPNTTIQLTKTPTGIDTRNNKSGHHLGHYPYAGLSPKAFERFKYHLKKADQKTLRKTLQKKESKSTVQRDLTALNYCCQEHRRIDIRQILNLEELFPADDFVMIAESAIINNCYTSHSEQYLEDLEKRMDDRDPNYKQRRRIRRQMAQKEHLTNALHLIGLSEPEETLHQD